MNKKYKAKLRKNSRSYRILKILAASSGILLLSTLNPTAGAQIIKILLSGYVQKKKFEKYRFLRDLKSLQERKLLTYQESPNGEIEMRITRRGKEIMLKYQIDDIKLKKPAAWDKKWRLVMFDIPQEYRLARDAFRKKLKDLKFHQLQKSVFLTPYPCEDEIDFIAEIFDVRKHTLFLIVEGFEGEEKLRYLFNVGQAL